MREGDKKQRSCESAERGENPCGEKGQQSCLGEAQERDYAYYSKQGDRRRGGPTMPGTRRNANNNRRTWLTRKSKLLLGRVCLGRTIAQKKTASEVTGVTNAAKKASTPSRAQPKDYVPPTTCVERENGKPRPEGQKTLCGDYVTEGLRNETE